MTFTAKAGDVFDYKRSEAAPSSILLLTSIVGDLQIGATFEALGQVRQVVDIDGLRYVACLTGWPLRDAPHAGILVHPPFGRSDAKLLFGQQITGVGYIQLSLSERFPNARRTGFGDSAALSARLIGLILAGRKTATCRALRDYYAEGEAIPQAGEVMLVEDWEGVPVLAYRLISVEVMRFDEVTETFARAEGEGSINEWRRAHRDYFARNGGFDPAMPLVCERFALLAMPAKEDG